MCWYFQGNKPSIGHLQISCGEILFVIFDRKGFRGNSSGKCQTIDLNKFIRIKFFKKGPRNPFHYLCSHSKLKAWTDWFSVWQKKFHHHHKTFPKLASQVVAGLLIPSSMPVYPALQSPFAVCAAAVPGPPHSGRHPPPGAPAPAGHRTLQASLRRPQQPSLVSYPGWLVAPAYPPPSGSPLSILREAAAAIPFLPPPGLRDRTYPAQSPRWVSLRRSLSSLLLQGTHQ